MVRLVVGIVLGLVLAGVVAVVVVAPLAVAGPGPFAGLYGQALVNVTAQRNAPASPPSQPQGAGGRGGFLGNRAALSGRDAYLGSCAQCHGAKGDGQGQFGQLTSPPATNLASQDVKSKSDGELFWIVKNGLGFTAMPAYGGQYSDAEISGMLAYIRMLQNGQGQPVAVPSPTAQQLASADPSSSNAAQRGAAVYFAQGCQECHGATGNAPGNLALRAGGETEAIRRGRPGMPAYGADQISDQQLTDLAAYMRTWPSTGGRRGERG